MNVAFRFGGMPYDVCERGLKLFAKEVLPVVKKWGPVKRPPRRPEPCASPTRSR
jgi:hypothetical protein